MSTAQNNQVQDLHVKVQQQHNLKVLFNSRSFAWKLRPIEVKGPFDLNNTNVQWTGNRNIVLEIIIVTINILYYFDFPNFYLF